MSVDGFDKRSTAATAASACSPRIATSSISAGSVRRSTASRRALGFRGVAGDAAERLFVAHRGNGGAAHVFGTGALRDGRQLALAPERRQRRDGGHRRRRRRASTPARRAGRPRGRARCLRIRCATMSASTAASVMRDTAARRTRASASSLANALERRRRRRRRSRAPLRFGCWGRDGWTWTAGGAYREFPLVVQTPATPLSRPAPSFLSVTSGEPCT